MSQDPLFGATLWFCRIVLLMPRVDSTGGSFTMRHFLIASWFIVATTAVAAAQPMLDDEEMLDFTLRLLRQGKGESKAPASTKAPGVTKAPGSTKAPGISKAPKAVTCKAASGGKMNGKMSSGKMNGKNGGKSGKGNRELRSGSKGESASSKAPKGKGGGGDIEFPVPNRCSDISPCDGGCGSLMCLPLGNLNPALPEGTLEFCVPSEYVDFILDYGFGATCGECPAPTMAPTPGLPPGCVGDSCIRAIDGEEGIVFCLDLPTFDDIEICIKRENVEDAINAGFGQCGDCPSAPTSAPTGPFPPVGCTDVVFCNTIQGDPGIYMCFVDRDPSLVDSYCIPFNQVQAGLDAGGSCGLCPLPPTPMPTFQPTVAPSAMYESNGLVCYFDSRRNVSLTYSFLLSIY